MQIIQQYPIQIEQWIQLPQNQFMGYLFDNGYNYIFGITPEDPKDRDCCYFNIGVEKKIVNQTTKIVVFYAKTYSVFKVKNSFQKPTPEFFFNLVEKATFDFATQFYYRTQNTSISHHKIYKPKFSEIKLDVEKTIDIWDKAYRINPLDTPPNWQTKFRDLPEIPENKRWLKGSHFTLEQNISFKLLNNKPITYAEEKAFIELTSYYKELDNKLFLLDYKSFTKEDFDQFKNYIFYAFNYIALLTNNLSIYQVYRLVVNENVTKKNESITNIDFLKYPPLEIVKKINKYNRANTPETNIFYAAENIDTLLKELRPESNKLLTVGVWQPKNINKEFISFPISHIDAAMTVSEGTRKATLAFEENNNFHSPLLKNYLRYYFKLLGREFSKKVTCHYEYLISALFSERIFTKHLEFNDENDFKYDCIIYPSVGNDYMTQNVAILPSTLDNDFILTEAFEFEVEEAYYDKKCVVGHPELITLAKIKNFKKTTKIDGKGEISW